MPRPRMDFKRTFWNRLYQHGMDTKSSLPSSSTALTGVFLPLAFALTRKETVLGLLLLMELL